MCKVPGPCSTGGCRCSCGKCDPSEEGDDDADARPQVWHPPYTTVFALDVDVDRDEDGGLLPDAEGAPQFRQAAEQDGHYDLRSALAGININRAGELSKAEHAAAEALVRIDSLSKVQPRPNQEGLNGTHPQVGGGRFATDVADAKIALIIWARSRGAPATGTYDHGANGLCSVRHANATLTL
jgi:hypothetical protein